MKKLISLLGLPILLSTLLPSLALGYSGVNLANTEADEVHFCNYNSSTGFYVCSSETTDASDTGTNDVALPTDTNDNITFGFSEMFDGVALDITTDADGFDLQYLDTAGGQYDFEYWNGTDWTDVEYTPDSAITLTYDFANGDEDVLYKTWVRPDDWVTRSVNGSSSMYYVRLIATDDYSSSALAGQAGLIIFNLEVAVRDEFGDPIPDMVQSDFTLTGAYGSDDTIYHFEEVEEGVYGFAIDAPLATDPEYTLDIRPEGYQGKDPARSGMDLDFTQYELESEDHAFGHRLSAVNEAGETVNIESAIAGDSSVDCVIDAGEAYCAVDTADDNSSSATVWADGYAESTGSIEGRGDDTDSQVASTITLEYGFVATVKDQGGNVITDATVMAGEDYSVSCTYLGTGRYGCAIPNSNGDPLVQVSAAGYETLQSAFTGDRDENTDGVVRTTFRLTEGEEETVVEEETGEETEEGDDDDDDSTEDGVDSDEDGLSDEDEADRGTDENDSDSDNDGIRDGAEVNDGTDPLDDEDYLANGEDYYIECEDPFTDTAGNFAEQSICILYDEGIVQGRSASTYEPSASITRAEFLKIALLNAGLTITPDSSVTYNDVEESDWYYSYITYATVEGYVEGYDDGGFHPNDEINRAEAMVMMMRIAGVEEGDVTVEDASNFSDVGDDDWFAWAVVEAEENRISEGYEDGTFRPGNSITRAEVAVIARRMWYVYFE